MIITGITKCDEFITNCDSFFFFYHKVWYGLLQIASDITLSATVHVYETFVRYNRLGAKKL